MKICVLQPEYSKDFSRIEELVQKELDLLGACDDSSDIIVLPEYSDVPAVPPTVKDFYGAVQKYNKKLIDAARETAIRTNAMVFVGAVSKCETGFRNSTYAFDRKGRLAGLYHKQHLVKMESGERGLDSEYTYEFSEPTVIEMEGLRFCFLTCYDFYFYEAYAAIARKNPDIIIGCSHQRSDPHDMSELFARFCAFNTNSYVLRASVSMGENSPVGGGSCVCAPDGKTLLQMNSRIGAGIVDIDPAKKFLKPAGFGNAPTAHHEYAEIGRRPWKYRPAGSAVIRPDSIYPYPRLCAHRGFNTIAPENSMPAFGAAIALGAPEIEFDLWATKDGEIVSLHDSELDRVSTGTGKIWDLTLEEVRKADFGVKMSGYYKGLGVVLFEDILKKYSCHTIMNVHIKAKDDINPLEEETLRKIIRLIDKYDARRHVYFMTGNNAIQAQLRALAPDICRCMGAGLKPWDIVDEAIEYGCQKVQLFKPYFNQEMIDKAHAHGILCNVFYADDPDEAIRYLNMGVDTILTNDYLAIYNATKEYVK